MEMIWSPTHFSYQRVFKTLLVVDDGGDGDDGRVVIAVSQCG